MSQDLELTEHSLGSVVVLVCQFEEDWAVMENLPRDYHGVHAAFSRMVESLGGQVTFCPGGDMLAVFGRGGRDPHHAGKAFSVAVVFALGVGSLGLQRTPQVSTVVHTTDFQMLGQWDEDPVWLGGGIRWVLNVASQVEATQTLVTQSALEGVESNPPEGVTVRREGEAWQFSSIPTESGGEAEVVCTPWPDSEITWGETLYGVRVATATTWEFPTTESEAPVLARLGRFRLVEQLGRGGMGAVWRAIDPYGIQSAIKVMRPEYLESQRARQRFEREARVMARLEHRHLCRIYGCGERDGQLYLNMELVTGASLDDVLYYRAGAVRELTELIRQVKEAKGTGGPGMRLPGARRLDLPVVLRLMEEVCGAVEFAHENGVLHRDLKPANILLRESGEAVVSDFGLAKMGVEEEVSLSMTGEVFGTLDFMPPEQAESARDIDQRGDVYALGAILYLMLTGQAQFKASGNFMRDVQRLCEHEVTSPRRHRRDLDPDLEAITLKALAHDPAERYLTVGAMREDLERFSRGETTTARPISYFGALWKVCRRHRVPAVTTVAVLVGIFAIGAAALYLVDQERQQSREALLEADRQRRMATSATIAANQAEEAMRKALQDAEEARQRMEASLREAQVASRRAQEAEDQVKEAESGLVASREELEQLRTEAEKLRQQAEAAVVRAEREAVEDDPVPFAEEEEETWPPVWRHALLEAAAGIGLWGWEDTSRFRELLGDLRPMREAEYPREIEGTMANRGTWRVLRKVSPEFEDQLKELLQAGHLRLAHAPEDLGTALQLGLIYLASRQSENAAVCFAYVKVHADKMGNEAYARTAGAYLDLLQKAPYPFTDWEQRDLERLWESSPLVRDTTLARGLEVIRRTITEQVQASRGTPLTFWPHLFETPVMAEQHLWLLKLWPSERDARIWIEFEQEPFGGAGPRGYRRLSLHGRAVKGLEPFARYLTVCEALDVGGSGITEIPRELLPALVELEVSGTGIRNLETKGLRSLKANYTPLEQADLRDLQRVELEGIASRVLTPRNLPRGGVLRFSPEETPDPDAVVKALRNREMISISTPDDPYDLPAEVFFTQWEKGMD